MSTEIRHRARMYAPFAGFFIRETPPDPYKAKGSAAHAVCYKSIFTLGIVFFSVPSIAVSDFRRANALPPAHFHKQLGQAVGGFPHVRPLDYALC
jgi:hypothetical protein